MDTVTIPKAEYERLKALEAQAAASEVGEPDQALFAFLHSRRRFDWRKAWEEVRHERRRAG